jgi:RNA polymerase sigma-70 factor, ECF subfamily
MDEADDEAMLRGLRDGHPDAWARLYDRHAERVWRMVARFLVAQPADVGDVVQETFLAAAKSARQFDSAKGTVWVWLWGIARRQTQLYLRKRPRERSQAEEFGTAHLREPLEDLADSEHAAAVRLALLELPEDYERLLTAKYLCQETLAQMAVQERISEVAVRSKLARARDLFRQKFPHLNPVPTFPVNEATHDTPG